ncbi:MAG: HK97 gp10 family phage protein [Fervidobacterium sp.]
MAGDIKRLTPDLYRFLQGGLRRYSNALKNRWQWLIENAIDPANRSAPASTTGALTKSIAVDLNQGDMSATIGSALPYAQYVEQGRSAGGVSEEAIRQWLSIKMNRYGWNVTDFNALLRSIVEKIQTQGYTGWEHLKSIVEDESFFDRNFGR